MHPQIKAGQIWQETQGNYNHVIVTYIEGQTVTVLLHEAGLIDMSMGFAVDYFLANYRFISPVQDLSPKMREELGRQVDQEWCDWFGPVEEDRWETLAESVKEGQRRIGVALYLRGYADGRKETDNE